MERDKQEKTRTDCKGVFFWLLKRMKATRIKGFIGARKREFYLLRFKMVFCVQNDKELIYQKETKDFWKEKKLTLERESAFKAFCFDATV